MKFLYARVSSLGQNEERQLVDTEQYDRTYVDKCSGKDADRPQLKAMMDNLRTGDSITCHSLDRLARNTFDLLELVKKITESGCSVEFKKENLKFEPNKDNCLNNLMLQILGAIAEFERSLIKTRQAEGIAIAKAKGKFKGGSKKLSEYDATELKELVSSGRISIKEAQKRYGISRASVYNYIK